MPGPLQILGFGAIAVDDIVYADQPLQSGKGRVTRRVTAHGGNVATALAAAAKLGARAGYLGWLSGPADRDPSAGDLVASGVDIDCAPRHPDAQPVRSTIIVGPDGGRYIAYDDAGMFRASPDFPEPVLRDARVLVVDGYAIAALPQVRRAHALGLSIVGDFEWTAGDETDRLVALCDHLVLPMGHAATMAGTHVPEDILQALWSETRVAVVLTDGEAGVYFRHRDDPNLWHLPAFEVTVLDTTGAGDCFHGAYAFALAQGQQTGDCVRFAAAAAALSVAGRGGRAALPDLHAVRALLDGDAAPTQVTVGTVGQARGAAASPENYKK